MSEEKYGAKYYLSSEAHELSGKDCDLYSYKVFTGGQSVKVDRGDSLIVVERSGDGLFWGRWIAGPSLVDEVFFGVLLRGYQCGDKACSINQRVNLPYINGCATRQIFPPERIGDPTLQQLTIPPYTSEQAHHIHPTPRVVLVTEGRGWSIVGQAQNLTETELLPGMVCILDPMCPHHFRTENEPLTVMPVHVWSSTPASMEQNHPMFNGTRQV